MWALSAIPPKNRLLNYGGCSSRMMMCHGSTRRYARKPIRKRSSLKKGGSTRDAKRVCAQCEVREQCLKWAIDHDERFGIWGGMSERERRRYKKERRERA